MTLDTRIYVLDEADAREVFAAAQVILAKYDEDGRSPSEQRSRCEQDRSWKAGESFVEPGSPWTIANEPDQGLPGWLMIHYRPGAELRTAETAGAHDEWCEPDCTGQYHPVACWLEISLDTAYSYRDTQGRSCGDLHAVFVADLGRWLDDRGLAWSWQNEFTSEVHAGEDRYVRLVDLASGGFEAQAWFLTSALPAILHDVAEES